MITISDGKLTIPEGQRFIGFTGDNRHTQKQFFIRNNTQSGWIYRLYLTFDDGTHNYFVLPATVGREGTWLTWDIEESHIFKSGLVKAQIKAFSNDNEVYHTTSDVFVAGRSTEEDEEFSRDNAEFLLYEKKLNELYRKMLDASAKMPYVGTNGNWYTYDISKDEYVDSGISSYVPIVEGGITPDKLSCEYWQKKVVIPVTDYGHLDDILANSESASTIYRLVISGLSPLYSIVGEGEYIALTDEDCQNMLIVNTINGDRWLYEKGSLQLERVEVDVESVSDESITPQKLDRAYWEKGYHLVNPVSTFDELFSKVGAINEGGTVSYLLVHILAKNPDTEEFELVVEGGNYFAYGVRYLDRTCVYLSDAVNSNYYTIEYKDGGYEVIEGDSFLKRKAFTVSTYAELDKVFEENKGKHICFDFTFPKSTELFHGAKDGSNFVSINGLFINTDSGKKLKYENGRFRDLSGDAVTADYGIIVNETHQTLSNTYDSGIGVVSFLVNQGDDDIPNGSYVALRYTHGETKGYMVINPFSGALYYYDRRTGDIRLVSSPVSVDAELDITSQNAVSNAAVTVAVEEINATLYGLEQLLGSI